MGNTNATSNQQDEIDKFSTTSLDGSIKEAKQTTTTWKFSTLNDEEVDGSDYINEKNNIVRYSNDEDESEDEKDGNYSSNFKKSEHFLVGFSFLFIIIRI